MREVDRIERQLRSSVQGDAWQGPCVLELLSDVDAARARSRPIPDAHTIWELVCHITTWLRAGIQGIAGETIDYPPEVDWPESKEDGEEAWRKAFQELKSTYEELCGAISELPDDRLGDVVAGKKYTVYVLLHGVVQHNVYHAGQIAMLKKILNGRS